MGARMAAVARAAQAPGRRGRQAAPLAITSGRGLRAVSPQALQQNTDRREREAGECPIRRGRGAIGLSNRAASMLLCGGTSQSMIPKMPAPDLIRGCRLFGQDHAPVLMR